jgi:DNA-binding MarR family transcriptional regulator
MAGKLQRELRKKKPFDLIEEEVYLNILRTGEHLSRALVNLMKEKGITGSQYNVLRILRGHGEAGVSCNEIAEQMVTHDPDLTRLLDRLEKTGLAKRERSTVDRRVVTAHITPKGLKLLESLDQPIRKKHQEQLKMLSASQLQELIELLEAIRSD